jgi:hypothetical protein
VLQWCEFIPIQVQTNVKLPILYLVDCIAKNIGQTYTTLFSQNIVKTFCSVFKVVSYFRRPVSTGVEIIIFGAEEVPKNVSFMSHFVVFFFCSYCDKEGFCRWHCELHNTFYYLLILLLHVARQDNRAARKNKMPNGIAFLYLLSNNSFYFILNMLFLILFFDNHQEFIVLI